MWFLFFQRRSYSQQDDGAPILRVFPPFSLWSPKGPLDPLKNPKWHVLLKPKSPQNVSAQQAWHVRAPKLMVCATQFMVETIWDLMIFEIWLFSAPKNESQGLIYRRQFSQVIFCSLHGPTSPFWAKLNHLPFFGCPFFNCGGLRRNHSHKYVLKCSRKCPRGRMVKKFPTKNLPLKNWVALRMREWNEWNHTWVFPKLGVPQNGWFIMENPPFSATRTWLWGWNFPHSLFFGPEMMGLESTNLNLTRLLPGYRRPQ